MFDDFLVLISIKKCGKGSIIPTINRVTSGGLQFLIWFSGNKKDHIDVLENTNNLILKNLPTVFWKSQQLHFDAKIGGYLMCFYQLRFENDGEDEIFEKKDVVVGLLKGVFNNYILKSLVIDEMSGCIPDLLRGDATHFCKVSKC